MGIAGALKRLQALRAVPPLAPAEPRSLRGWRRTREPYERRPPRKPGQRPWSALTRGSVAGQLFVLQVVVVLLLVLAAVVALVLQVRRDSTAAARERSLAVAESFANSPGMVRRAQTRPIRRAVLQPRAEAARKRTGVDFIVVMNTDGIRYTHPISRTGSARSSSAPSSPRWRGHVVTETINGTIGQARAGGRSRHADRTARSSAWSPPGSRSRTSAVSWTGSFPLLLGAAAGALALATGGTALVSRRLRRQTHGLGPAEMTRMYEHHDAVLHAVREGVLIVGGDGGCCSPTTRRAGCSICRRTREGRQVADLGPRARARRSCWPRAGWPPTRCTWPGTGCWRSTSGSTDRARRPAGQRRDAARHHRAAGCSPAGPSWPASG